MNSKSREIIGEIIRESKAAIKCRGCGNYEISANDPEADKLAYAMVTEAWKRGEFRVESREAIIAVVKLALNDVNIDCPSC